MSGKIRAVSVFAVALSLVVTGCDDSRACSSCNGTGKINVVDSWSGQWATVPCPQCGGTGEIRVKDTRGTSTGRLIGLLQSWGVPGGIATVAVIASAIYMDCKRNRDRHKKD